MDGYNLVILLLSNEFAAFYTIIIIFGCTLLVRLLLTRAVAEYLSLLTVMCALSNLLLTIVNNRRCYILFANAYFISDLDTWFMQAGLVVIFGIFFLLLLTTKNEKSYRKHLQPDYIYIYLFIFFAGFLIITVSDYVLCFILLEITGVATFVLLALGKTRFGYQAAVKYLIYSAFGSLLYVFAGVLLLTNIKYSHFSIAHIGSLYLATSHTELPFLSEILLLFGVFVKLGIGPFFSWVADTYQAPDFFTFLFIATAGKLPLVFAVTRFAPEFSEDVSHILIWITVLSTLYAASLFVYSHALRRFFAYSSIFSYSLAVLLLIVGFTSVRFFIYFIFFYIILSMFLYTSFNVYTETSKKEISEIEKLATFDGSPASSWFQIATLFTTGLPPFGIFMVKALALGAALPKELKSFSKNFFGNIEFISVLIYVIAGIGIYGYFHLVAQNWNYERRMENKDVYRTNPSRNFIALLFMVSVFGLLSARLFIHLMFGPK